MSRSIEDAARSSFTARAQRYVTSATHADPSRLARIVEMTEPKATWRALDVGTGTGHTAFAFAPAVAWMTGVDLTEAMLRQAERVRKDRGYGNVELRVADVHRMPFADGTFDLVTCRRAAHHFGDIETALGEIRRVLRPGGRLMIDDRSSPQDDEVDAILHRLDCLHDHSHVRQYRASEWEAMLRDSGFTVRAVEAYQQDRPLDAFTLDVDEQDVAEINQVVAGLTERQRGVLNARTVDGKLHLKHFYVTLVADRA